MSERKAKDAVFAQRDAPRRARVSWIPSSLGSPRSAKPPSTTRRPGIVGAATPSHLRAVAPPPREVVSDVPPTQTSPLPVAAESSGVMLASTPAPDAPESTPGFFDALPDMPPPSALVASVSPVQAAIDSFIQAAEALSEIRAIRGSRVERDLVELAGAIAERVLGRELRMDPTLLAALARDGIQALADRESVTVRFSTDTPVEAKAQLMEAVTTRMPGCRVVFDRELVAGSCVVESAQGFVDESVTTRLDIVMEQLGFGGGGRE